MLEQKTKKPLLGYTFVDDEIVEEIKYAKTFASNGYVGRVMGYHGPSGYSATAQFCNGYRKQIRIDSLKRLRAFIKEEEEKLKNKKYDQYEDYIFITNEIIHEIREATKYSSKRYVAKQLFGYSGRTCGSIINKIFARTQHRMHKDGYAKLKEFLIKEQNNQSNSKSFVG